MTLPLLLNDKGLDQVLNSKIYSFHFVLAIVLYFLLCAIYLSGQDPMKQNKLVFK